VAARPDTPTTLTVRVELKPGARTAGLVGDGTILRVKVKAPPIDGRANAEAIELIASAFGVPKSRVALEAGARSRSKRFRISGATRCPAGYSAGS
jgi:uncharacterized protein (TIGR00251 family)